MRRNNRKFYSGFNLVELMVAVLISSILVLVVGVLLVSGSRSWQQTYTAAHKQSEEDATAVTAALGSIGRMSNRANYVVYTKTGSTFTPAVSSTPGVDTVVWGDAVEFRYWNVNLDTGDTQHLMDVTKTATAYALFYLDSGQLKVDYGPYPPGAVPAGGGSRNTSGVNTVVLAGNASIDPNSGLRAFSHTTLNGIGKGCVRISVILTDPSDGEQLRLLTSVLMRNWWPR
jgi:prepilin-type N-terminal cleavage/methylation domain-containing protein